MSPSMQRKRLVASSPESTLVAAEAYCSPPREPQYCYLFLAATRVLWASDRPAPGLRRRRVEMVGRGLERKASNERFSGIVAGVRGKRRGLRQE